MFVIGLPQQCSEFAGSRKAPFLPTGKQGLGMPDPWFNEPRFAGVAGAARTACVAGIPSEACLAPAGCECGL